MKSDIEVYCPGAVLCYIWGYGQRNVDFFQIVKRSGSTIYMRPIEAKRVPRSLKGATDRVQPVPGKFVGEEVLRKKIGHNGVQMRHGWVKVVDPKESHYRSWCY